MPAWLAAIPVIGSLFEKIGEAIDKNVTTDEERLSLKRDLTGLQVPVIMAAIQADAELRKALLDLWKVEAASEDKFIRRSRPALVWLTFLNLAWATNIAPILKLPASDAETATWLFSIVFGVWGTTRGGEKMLRAFKRKEQI